MKTALVYVRRSFIRKGEEAISPEKQEANCQRICREAGWTAEVYRDAEEGKHYTATSEEGRPAWLRLKRQLGRPDVAAVVVDSLDRAYRSLQDFLNFLALVDRYTLRFISRRERIDTESPMGQAILKIMMIFFELEAEMARERVSDVIEYRKAAGIHWGNNPFGLDRDDDGVLVANEDLPVAILLLELYASDKGGYTAIARKLNAMEKRFRGRYGKLKPFTRHSVRSVVSNVLIYLGYVPRGRGKDQRHILLDPEEDLVDQLVEQTEAVRGQHEAFISRELANRVLAARRRKVKPRKPSRTYLLSGVLHCAHCGCPMRGQTPRRPSEKAYYRHSNEACAYGLVGPDAEKLEAQVIDLLQALKLPPALQEAIRERAREQGALLPEDDEARKAIAHLRGKLNRLKELYVEGEYTKKEYTTKKEGILVELREWESQVGKQGNVEHALLNLDDLAEVIRQGKPLAQKKAIAALFERIEVDWRDQIVKAVPQEWCRPLLETLQSLLSRCVIRRPQGTSTAHYVAHLQWPCTINLENLLYLMAA